MLLFIFIELIVTVEFDRLNNTDYYLVQLRLDMDAKHSFIKMGGVGIGIVYVTVWVGFAEIGQDLYTYKLYLYLVCNWFFFSLVLIEKMVISYQIKNQSHHNWPLQLQTVCQCVKKFKTSNDDIAGNGRP